MRALLVVAITFWMAAAVLAAAPYVEDLSSSSGPVSPSLLRRDSVLRKRWQPRKSSPFTLRTSLDSNRRLVRLVSDDDDDAGTAYIGVNPHLEPELDGEQLPLIEPPPALEESVISAKDLKGQAVPLDGAAKKAEDDDDDDEEKKPATERSSFGWIAGTGNQLGMLEWVGRDLAVMDYAASDRASFRIGSGHAFTWLTGPDTTDLPPYLFSIFVDVGAGVKASDDWSFDVIISPSWNTDFANKSYQLFRLPWQAVNTFKVNEELKVVLGITDLDREDIHLLPVAGFIYKPLDGSVDLDLVFPRPKASWRLSRSDSGPYWGYLAGELGGNSYSIQRPGAIHDIVTLRDYRLLLGFEHRGERRHATRFEVGWVFGRAVEYASGIGNYNPGDTAIIRLSSDY